MGTVLAKYGLTAGYTVAEHRKEDSPTQDHCIVAISVVEPNIPSVFLREMALQTYEIVKELSKVEVKITDN
ncbi:hypothetical protein [Spirosoma lituiforme]